MMEFLADIILRISLMAPGFLLAISFHEYAHADGVAFALDAFADFFFTSVLDGDAWMFPTGCNKDNDQNDENSGYEPYDQRTPVSSGLDSTI